MEINRRKYSSDVFFVPWEGAEYEANAKKLLLVGESHHGSDPQPTWTIEVVRRYIANEIKEPWFRTFTTIAQLLTGKNPEAIDRSKFWNAVSFYNYVQQPVPGARDRPTEEMFVQGRAGFREVVTVLRPTHILALGDILWQHMPEFDEERPAIKVEAVQSDCGIYKSPDGRHRSLALHTPHPVSWGFSPKAWHPLVVSFLALRP